MRITINSEDFFVFKDVFYSRTSYYIKESNGIVGKYFEKNKKSRNQETQKLIDIIVSSPKTPELKKAPAVVTVSLEEQLEELKNYLKKYFKIEMDERNRFFFKTKKTRSATNKNGFFYFQNYEETTFVKWDDIINLYNSNDHININNVYLKKLYMRIPSFKEHYEKKYVYLTLSRKNNHFSIFNNQLVTLPE